MKSGCAKVLECGCVYTCVFPCGNGMVGLKGYKARKRSVASIHVNEGRR